MTEWSGDGWRVIHGDCLDVLPTLGQCDHVITDPPYEAEAHTKGRRVKGRRVLKKTDRCGSRTLKVAVLPFDPIGSDTRDAVSSLVAKATIRWAIVFCQCEAAQAWAKALAPMVYKRTGIWVKPDGQPQISGDRPGMGYESIVFCHRAGRSRWNGGGRHGVFTHLSSRYEFKGRQLHPTTKPLPLMLELVSLFTYPGELVVDPFCGSGTTGVACMRLGRRFIGIEKDAEYADLARRRLVAEGNQSDVRSHDSGQVPLFANMDEL